METPGEVSKQQSNRPEGPGLNLVTDDLTRQVFKEKQENVSVWGCA